MTDLMQVELTILHYLCREVKIFLEFYILLRLCAFVVECLGSSGTSHYSSPTLKYFNSVGRTFSEQQCLR